MIAGAPIKVVATLLGLFGNDNNKYRWIRTRHLDADQ